MAQVWAKTIRRLMNVVVKLSVWIRNQLDVTFVLSFIFSFTSCPKHVEQLVKDKIKDNTKVTSSWFLIHTDLRCTVNHIS